jgi:hypothetical protein
VYISFQGLHQLQVFVQQNEVSQQSLKISWAIIQCTQHHEATIEIGAKGVEWLTRCLSPSLDSVWPIVLRVMLYCVSYYLCLTYMCDFIFLIRLLFVLHVACYFLINL